MIDVLRSLIENNKYMVRINARKRMLERNIKISEVKESLNNGEIIEEYLDDKPFPSYLIHGTTSGKRSMHSIWAIEGEERAYLISIYEPDPGKWIKDKERKK